MTELHYARITETAKAEKLTSNPDLSQPLTAAERHQALKLARDLNKSHGSNSDAVLADLQFVNRDQKDSVTRIADFLDSNCAMARTAGLSQDATSGKLSDNEIEVKDIEHNLQENQHKILTSTPEKDRLLAAEIIDFSHSTSFSEFNSFLDKLNADNNASDKEKVYALVQADELAGQRPRYGLLYDPQEKTIMLA